jgi:hypothetical protein
MFAGLLICTTWMAVSAEPSQMEPLHAEQLEQIRDLVRRTKEENDRLKAQFDACQEELMRLYGQFQLDEAAVIRKQAEILDLQKKMLANHHQLQVGLRQIVGEERFKILNQRILRLLNASAEKK